MSTRIYMSGAAKRKVKKLQDDQVKRMKGLMMKYTTKIDPSTTSAADISDESSLASTTDTETSIQNCVETIVTDDCDQLKLNHDVLKENDNPQLNESSTSNLDFFNADPATWNSITDSMIEYFIHRPPPQNMDILSETGKIISGSKRILTRNNFYRIKKNEEKIPREWLVLSTSTKSLFCWVCKLFPNSSSYSSKLSTTGFDDWKHVSERLSEHENSFVHRDAVLKMLSRLKSSERIDTAVVLQSQKESHYWRSVLSRVVATIKFLSLRGMAFFGEDETIGSVHNGNFLGCLELIAEFDPFLATHLQKYGNPGKGNVNYMSSTSIDEFIELMAKEVLRGIIVEIKSAKYYSLVLDSTPDIAHLDQLCLVMRYINPDYNPVERFIKFVPIYGHGAEYLTDTVLSCLEELELNIHNCRGQSYDNASNMAGKYTGLQARIKEINELADFVPCSAHSLNLVGMHAVESCTPVLNFFSLLQELYTFFSISTYRWQLLHENLENQKLTLKNSSTTRWCAEANATRSLRKNYQRILDALDELANSEEQASNIKLEARSLHKKLLKFENALNTVIWDTILQRLNQTNKVLQNSTGNIGELTPLFDSLIGFIKTVRENFDVYEQEAEKISNISISYDVVRKRKVPKSRFPDYFDTPEVEFEPRDKFIKTCHYVLCDSLISNLSFRKKPYDELTKLFSSLLNMHTNPLLHQDSKLLQKKYSSDLEDDFTDELQQFSSFIEEGKTIQEMLKTLQNPHLASAFPNVETALRIFLTMPISNCTGERSFSLLKRLKSPLRSYIQQKKLSALALLSLNGDLTTQLSYDHIIDKFAECKMRKKPLKI